MSRTTIVPRPQPSVPPSTDRASENPPDACTFCGAPTYARICAGGICAACLATMPRLIADFTERLRAGRI